MGFFLQVFNDSHFLLNNFPHICLECLFHMDNHIDLVGTVKFVEKLVNQKTLVKKALAFFGSKSVLSIFQMFITKFKS